MTNIVFNTLKPQRNDLYSIRTLTKNFRINQMDQCTAKYRWYRCIPWTRDLYSVVV